MRRRGGFQPEPAPLTKSVSIERTGVRLEPLRQVQQLQEGPLNQTSYLCRPLSFQMSLLVCLVYRSRKREGRILKLTKLGDTWLGTGNTCAECQLTTGSYLGVPERRT